MSWQEFRSLSIELTGAAMARGSLIAASVLRLFVMGLFARERGVDVRLAVIQLRRERREGEARSRGHGRDQDGSTESESQQERRHRVGSLRQLVSAEGYNLRSLQGPERAWSWRASTPLAPFGNEKKVFASFFKKNASLPYVTHRNFVDRASASFFEKRYLRTTTRRVSSPSLSR
jgi:hypothetical protein